MKGYIQVYTGAGKGKTTAAIGLAVRAVGAGKRVFFLQFMKSRAYSEQTVLERLDGITLETVGKPFFIAEEGTFTVEELRKWDGEVVVFPKGQPPASYIALVQSGIKMALDALAGDYDIIILDEYNVALHFGLVTKADTDQLLAARRGDTELIFTGRGATPELIAIADLVTEMKEVKHYYHKGVIARRGIEN